MSYDAVVEPSAPVWIFVLPSLRTFNLDPVAVKGYSDVEVSGALAFTAHMVQWKKNTRFMSSVDDIVSDDTYRQIVAMGPQAIPLILEQLAAEPEPHHWFVALAEITGIDPVPETACGDLVEMAAAWLQWGREGGVI